MSALTDLMAKYPDEYTMTAQDVRLILTAAGATVPDLLDSYNTWEINGLKQVFDNVPEIPAIVSGQFNYDDQFDTRDMWTLCDGMVILVADMEFTVDGSTFTGFGLNAPVGVDNISVDWGDGNTELFSGDGNLNLLAHTYADSDPYTILVSSGGATEFYCAGDAPGAIHSIVDITTLPSTLINMVFYQQDFDSIDTTLLTSCTIFACISCASLTTINTTGLTSCTTFYCSGCALDVTNVNNALINLEANGLPNGLVALEGQTPAAAPTGAGATAAADLVTNGWTVSTDV